VEGSLSFEPPMLVRLAFPVLFTIGGFSGLMLAIVPADYQYQDTYFVVAHFHYVLVPGAVFASWRGVLTGCRNGPQDVRPEARDLAFLAVGDLRERAVLPAALPGTAGMPRRIPDYAVQFTDWTWWPRRRLRLRPGAAAVPYIIWKCVRSASGVGKKAWEGAHGLEWELPSPPPITPGPRRRRMRSSARGAEIDAAAHHQPAHGGRRMRPGAAGASGSALLFALIRRLLIRLHSS